MSCDSSYLSPTLEFDPDPLTAEAINKSGKRCGIYALICGIEPFLAAIFTLLMNVFAWDSLDSSVGAVAILTAIILDLFCLPCIAGGIVFGMIGRDTEGKRYATIGLWLSLVYCVILIMATFVTFAGFMFFMGGSGVSGGSGGRCC